MKITNQIATPQQPTPHHRTYLAMLIASAALVSCGGGRSSSSSATSEDVDGQSPEIVGVPDSVPGNDETDGSPVVSNDSPGCSSNTPTSISVVGNNTFEFDAAAGQCFGLAEPSNIEKLMLPITARQDVDNSTVENPVSVPAEARITSMGVESSLVDGFSVLYENFIIDLTNTHSLPVCIEDDGMDLLDADGQIVDDFISINLAGDQYQIAPDEVDFGGSSRFNNCIPPGETRSLYGNRLVQSSSFDSGEIPTYVSGELKLEVEVLNATAIRAEPLTPGELLWTLLPQEDGGLPSAYPYRTTVTVQNSTSQTSFVNISADVLYLDDDGFLIHDDSVGIEHFLNITSTDITDEDRTLDAGGLVGYATWDAVSDLSVNSFLFQGPANRAIVHISRCVESAAGIEC